MAPSNLDKIFNPKSVALIGASDKKGSVGYYLMKNLTELGYNGKFYPVNVRKNEIMGHKAYPSVDQIPEQVDLAIVATPANTVPEVVDQCGKAGIGGMVIISAGFKEIGEEGRKLETQIQEISKKYGIRIIGPNCLGIVRPSNNLNATFAQQMPKPGNILRK